MSLPPIPMRALTIQGSYVGSLPEMKELMDLVRRKGLPAVPVKTRRSTTSTRCTTNCAPAR